MSINEIPQRQAPGSAPTAEERAVAARIRIRLDKQDKIETPPWILELAQSDQHSRAS